MSYKTEAKEEMQKLYGGYLSMLKAMGAEGLVVPYHSFTLEIYNKTKELYKKLKQ